VSRLRLVAGLTLSAALVAYLLWSVDLAQVARELRRADPGWTALGAALAVVGLWVRARRWRYLFPPGSDPPGLVPAIMIGYMVNNVLPLRAGEVVRVYVVGRRWAGRFWTALATLVVERVLDSLAIVLILGLLVLLIPVPPFFQWTALTVLAVDVVAVAALSVMARAPERCRRLLERLLARRPAVAGRVARALDTFLAGLDGVRAPRHALPLLIWTALVWLMPALAAWAVLRALGLGASLTAGWTVLAFVGLGVSIPSAPGYVGVFHYAAVLAVEIFGVPRSAAVSYALLFHATQYVPVTLVGWVFFVREHVSLAEATRRPEIAGARPPA
jgi:uncharacterized protein (TIRG00374 family)